jgi:hypothetical protein
MGPSYLQYVALMSEKKDKENNGTVYSSVLIFYLANRILI